MENYHILERIGEGSFGKVYRGRRKYTGQIVALKFVSKRGKTPRDLQNLREEINILRRLNHCNIIAILDSFETDGEFCMVTEYAQGELFQVLTDDQQLPEAEIRLITIQLLQALQVLHRQRIIHRDMKPQNILIGSKQQIKIADFGFARAISHESSVLTSIKGTPLYMAPELVQEKPYNCTVDLWSLGVILYELAVGTPPFYTDKIVTLVQMIVREPVRFPTSMSPPFKSFLSGLLTKDPKLRLSWPAILHHPFVVETQEELQRRLRVEDEFRQLPRFFSSENHEPVDPAALLKPSVERLRQSGQWQRCDPETGRRVDEDVAPLKQQEPRGADLPSAPPPPPQVEPADAFVAANDAWAESVRGGTGVDVAVSDKWSLLFQSFVAAPRSEESSSAMTAALTALHKALAVVLHQGSAPPSPMDKILATRSLLHRFVLDYLPRSPTEDVLLHAVRVCTIFTTVVNTIVGDEGEGRRGGDPYRQCCATDLRLLAALLLSPTGAVTTRALKWLGGMLANARKLTPLLEEVPSSGVVAALCERLAAGGGLRSPGGTASSTQSLFAVFALAAFVQPDGRKWGPLPAFPVMTLVDNGEGEGTEEEVRHLYKMRVKIHGEVTAQLLRRGLPELLALLHDELQSPSKEDEEEEEEEEPDQSTVACVLKILVHACRSSSPLAKKLTASRVRNRDIVGLTLALLSPSHPLRPFERSVAVELLVILLRRQVLTTAQVWACSSALYPLLLRSTDAAVLSHLCSFFSDVIESGAVGDSGGGDAVGELVRHGVLSAEASAAVWRLLAHDSFAALPSRDRRAHLQTIACYNVRAQGLVDAGVVLLLRVASRALSGGGGGGENGGGAPSPALPSFLSLFTSASSWPPLQRLVASGGDDLLSPWGLFCLLKLLRLVRELPPTEAAVNHWLVPSLVALLDVRHIASLRRWPEVVGGGGNAVKALVHALVKVLGIPFVQPSPSDLAVAQETLYDAHCVDRLLAVLQHVADADASVLELPMSFLSRLVTSSEHFAAQFVAANGVAIVREGGMLQGDRASPSLAIDTLLIISQLARASPDYYAGILSAGVVPALRELVRHREPMVRAKALNCVGNLCRHSTLFYDAFAAQNSTTQNSTTHSVLDGVVQGLADVDGYVRRFACFAIGNAAFHTQQLYGTLGPAVPPLVANLRDADEKTRSNAAGALGNLVRNSGELCGAMIRHHAPQELWALAQRDPSVASRRIVLFSLGNFCVYPDCVHALTKQEPDFVARLDRLHDDAGTDDVARKNIRRILGKLELQN